MKISDQILKLVKLSQSKNEDKESTRENESTEDVSFGKIRILTTQSPGSPTTPKDSTESEK